MIGLSFAMAHTGFVALCLALERHHEQVLGSRCIPSPRGQLLSFTGWLLLAASLAPLVQASGWGLGLVSWAGLLTAAALPVVLMLTFQPRLVMATGAIAVLGGTLSLLQVLG